MRTLLAIALYSLSFKLCEGAVMREDMRMDEIIMAAAESHEMFDLVHLMDGELMVMTELDILMNITELSQYKLEGSRTKRKAISNNDRLWRNSNVYYDFVSSDFSARDTTVIQQAIADWENFTCLNFIRSSTRPDRIVFRNGDGCYSRLGRSGGVQPIALAPGCRTKGVVIHEIGHAIGWIHEQARPDRDEFIIIDFSKIPSNWIAQFSKVRADLINDRGVTYDYDSVMHYSGNVFSPRTIITRDPAAQNRLGQRRGLSFRDIKLANLMYRCAERTGCPSEPCPGEGFRRKDCICVCPGPLSNPLVPCSNTPVVTTSTAAATTPSTESPVSQGSDCRDLRSDCGTLKATGSCTSDPARMSVFCRQSCDLCNAETACMDYDDGCSFFASNGYCEREGIGRLFQQECPLSCKICQPTDRCQALLDATSGSSICIMSLIWTVIVHISMIAV